MNAALLTCLLAAAPAPEYELWIYGYNLANNAHELSIKDARFKWRSFGRLAPNTNAGRGRDAAFVVPVAAGVIKDVVELRVHNPRGGSWFGIIKAVYVMPYAGTSPEEATRRIQTDPAAALARARFARVWTLKRGQTNTGVFSVETRTRRLRIGPVRPRVPDADKRIVLRPRPDGKVDFTVDFRPAAFWRQAIVRGQGDSAFYLRSLRGRALCARGTAGMAVRVAVLYRFTCDRVLRNVRAAARCHASQRHFASSVRLSLSPDGAHWPLAQVTRDGPRNQFDGELALDASHTPALQGVSEFWARLEFEVRCAVDTWGGASAEPLHITAQAGPPARPAPRPAAQVRFERARRRLAARGRIHALLLDAARCDGLRTRTLAGDDLPAVSAHAAACAGGLDAGRAGDAACWRLSEQIVPRAPAYTFPSLAPARYALVVPLRIDTRGAPALVEAGYLAGPQGSPRLRLLWDEEELAAVDARNPYDVLRTAYAVIPPGRAQGAHRLVIEDADGDTAADHAVVIDAVRVSALGSATLAPAVRRPAAGPAPALRLHAGFFLPDANPDAVQLAGLPRHFKKGFDYTTCGALLAYVRNAGARPLRIRKVRLFDRPIERLRRPFKSIWRPDENAGKHTLEFDRPEVLWYRVRPETLEPGCVAEVVVRFARAPGADAIPLALGDGQGRLARFEIPRRPPGLELRGAAFSPDLDALTLYAAGAPAGDPLAEATLDGRDITARCAFQSTGWPSGLWLVRARLPAALPRGSYHVVRLRTRAGRETAASLRAEPAFFSIGLFGSFRLILARRERLHVNTYVGHSVLSPAQLAAARAAGLRALVPFHVDLNRYKRCAGLHAYYMTDEPDAKDDPLILGRPRWIGRQTWGLEREFLRALARLDPTHPSFLLADQTTMPFNWFIYGRLADLFCTDPYSYNPRYVRAVARTARRAAAPRPCWIAVRSYWRPGRGRPVTPTEARLMALAAAGEGASGVSYWIYDRRVSGFAGMAASPALEAEASRVNAELEQAAARLAKACPTDAARADRPQVMVRALLCGEEAMVVVAMNEAYEITKQPLRAAAQTNVRVTVRLPAFWRGASAELLRGADREPLALRVRGREATFILPRLETARLCVLRAGR